MSTRNEVNIDNVRRYVALDAERLSLRKKLEEIGEQMDEVSEEILAQMLESGSSSVGLEGSAMIKFSKDLFCFKASAVEKDVFLKLLRKHGYGDMIRENFPWQTLTATLKELRANGEDFDDELLEACSVQERAKLTVYHQR